MLAALVSIPFLIRTIGDGRFGFLSIAWMLIGYFGLLDFGIGRALTYGVSRRLAHDPVSNVSDLIWTGLGTLGILGMLAAALIWSLSGWLVFSFMNMQPDLRQEALHALRILAMAVPFVILSAGLRGVLEAQQQFKSINLALMPLGVMLFVGPLIAIQFSASLPPILLSLLIVRFTTFLVLFLLCVHKVKGFLRIRLSKDTLKELLSFGGWITISNIASPVMVNMDRLFLASQMSVSAVTYYVTPFEIVSKLLIFPGAVANVSFPEFSRLAKLNTEGASRSYFFKALRMVLVLVLPPALTICFVAHLLLKLWISTEMADRSSGIMRLLAVGIVINGISYIPFAYIQGVGRSDITAKFHLAELIVYVPTLLLMISWLGLIGVAVAWVLRVLLDAILLFGYASMNMKGHPPPPCAERGS